MFFDLIFYLIGGIGCLCATYYAKIPLSSFSGIYLRFLLVFVYLPGYYLYRGGILYDSQATINFPIYALLFSQILISCTSAWMVWNVGINIKIKFTPKRYFGIKYSTLLFIVIIYTIAYFNNFIDSIPIMKIASGDFLSVGASLRSDLTHGFQESSIFAYYRPITKDLLFLLLFTLIIYKNTKIVFKWILALLLLFVLLAHLEKSYAFTLFLAFVMSKVMQQRVPVIKEISLGFVGIAIALLVTYLFFADSLSDAAEYLPLRLMAQIGYIPEQLRLSTPHAPLFLNGINLGSLGRYLDVEFIDISRMAFDSVHPNLSMLGISGSSAGLAISDAYMIFGLIGIPLLFVISVMHFYIDRILRVSIYSATMMGLPKAFLFSLYFYFACFYPLFFIGSFLGIFSVPYIFQQGLLLALLYLIILMKITIVLPERKSCKSKN